LQGQARGVIGPEVRDYSEIEVLGGKIGSYLFLRESTDLMNATIKAKQLVQLTLFQATERHTMPNMKS
jgi:hypothetical protein